MIPAMHDERLVEVLRKYASWTPSTRTIVEVGTWLGASAYHLLDASSPAVRVHLYDRWCATPSEVQKAQDQGEHRLSSSEVYEDIVRENLSEFGDRAVFHRTDDVRHAVYAEKEPIGMYVDDASKNQIDEVIARFDTRFVWGSTIIALMDYSEPVADQLRAYADRQEDWKFIEKKFGCAVYRYG